MIKWNEYTWYSKTLAFIFFFFILPPWIFYLGIQYEKVKEVLLLQTTSIQTVETKVIPDKKDKDFIRSAPLLVDTTQWLTFKNEKYGYEIKYPNTTTYSSLVPDDPKYIKFNLENAVGVDYKIPWQEGKGGPVEYKDEKRFTLVIISSKAQGDLTVDQWVAKEKSAKQAPQPIIENKITVDGENAYYIEYPSGAGKSFGIEGYDYVAVYVIHNGIEYRINGFRAPDKIYSFLKDDPGLKVVQKYEILFNSMLESIHFPN